MRRLHKLNCNTPNDWNMNYNNNLDNKYIHNNQNRTSSNAMNK